MESTFPSLLTSAFVATVPASGVIPSICTLNSPKSNELTSSSPFRSPSVPDEGVGVGKEVGVGSPPLPGSSFSLNQSHPHTLNFLMD